MDVIKFLEKQEDSLGRRLTEEEQKNFLKQYYDNSKQDKKTYEKMSKRELNNELKNRGFKKAVPNDKKLKVTLLEQMDKGEICSTNSVDGSKGYCHVENIKSPKKSNLGDVGVYIEGNNKEERDYLLSPKVKLYEDNNNNIKIVATKKKIDSFEKYYKNQPKKVDEDSPLKELLKYSPPKVSDISKVEELEKKIEKDEATEAEILSMIKDGSPASSIIENINSKLINENDKPLILILDEIKNIIGNEDEFIKELKSIEKILKSIEKKDKYVTRIITDDKSVLSIIQDSSTKNTVEIKEEVKEEIKINKEQINTLKEICKNKNSMRSMSKKSLIKFLKMFNIDTEIISKKKNDLIRLLCALTIDRTINPSDILSIKNLSNETKNNFEIFVVNKNLGVYLKKSKSWSDKRGLQKIVIDNQVLFGSGDNIHVIKELAIDDYKDFDEIKEESIIDDLYSVLSKQDNITTFLILLEKSKSLQKILKDSRYSLTVFVPNDDFFKTMNEKDIKELLENKKKIKEILSYHILKTSITSNKFNELSINKEELETLNKKNNIKLYIKDDEISVNNQAGIVETNIEGSNGLIHIIDNLLTPLKEEIEEEKEIEDVLEKTETNSVNISKNSGVIYTKKELSKMKIPQLKQILTLTFGEKGGPTKKNDIIEYILGTQKESCNKETACEEGYACDITNDINNGTCVPNIKFKGKFCVDLDNRKYFGSKKSLIQFLIDYDPSIYSGKQGKKNINKKIKDCKVGEKIISSLKKEQIEIIKTLGDTESKEDDVVAAVDNITLIDTFGTDIPSQITVPRRFIDSRSPTKTGSILPIIDTEVSVKTESDIEVILSGINNTYDIEPISVNKRTKEQIARCLGLLP